MSARAFNISWYFAVKLQEKTSIAAKSLPLVFLTVRDDEYRAIPKGGFGVAVLPSLVRKFMASCSIPLFLCFNFWRILFGEFDLIMIGEFDVVVFGEFDYIIFRELYLIIF